METPLILEMLFNVIGGLSIFLLGMHNMSNGMQAVAGEKMRQLINAVTNNRFMALVVGFLVTAIIQFMGANVGTTVTGWILVLQIGKYGLLTLGIAGLFYLFSKQDRIRYTSMMIMGVGMVFFGLELMKNGFKPIRDIPQFTELFLKFTPDTVLGLILCALTGAIVTAIVQSSSATVGIAMGMASTGVITFETSVALILGMNIGTTITAFLASLGTTTNAKRAAYGHSIFNILGVLWILPFFPLYVKILPTLAGVYPGTMVMKNGVETFPYIIKGIAIAHTTFNILNVVVFLPFVNHLAGLLLKLAPAKPFKEEAHLTNLDIRMLETPIMVVEQSRKEILHMGENIHRMHECLRDIISNKDVNDELIKKVFHREEVLDIIQKEISTFLVNILSGDIPHHLVDEAHMQIRVADEYESVSDAITNILKQYLRLHNEGITFPKQKRKEILELHEMVASYFSMVDSAIAERKPQILPKVRAEGNAITHHFREIRNNHLHRISQTKTDPLLSVSYINMLTSYRRIRDHVLNIAEALAGEK